MKMSEKLIWGSEAIVYPGFPGKVALITGASSGIGQAVSVLFAKNGVRTCLVGRNREALSVLSDEIKERGGECIVCEADVTNEKDIKKAFATVLNQYERLDILCNVAGGSLGLPNNTDELTLEDFKAVTELNIYNVFLCCREAVPLMKRQKYGRIVNVSSLSGEVASEVTNSAYAASKAAINQFTRHLAREIGIYGITVNCVCPGYTLASERIEQLWQKSDMEAIFNRLALRRPANALEQASAIVFLASDAASYITGEILDVNGGAILG